VVVVGATASGKTALACALAGPLNAEIVSADSQQCYAGLDIGTAKPTLAERARARHHLLDLASPETQLDAAVFVERADAAIDELTRRGKRALVVGGTGLWIRALLRGLVEAPGADPAFRTTFRAEVAESGLSRKYDRLLEVDPVAARGIRPEDRVRIERALEVFHQTGRPLSALQQEHRFAQARYRVRVVLVDPPREVLWERIARRTHSFFATGGGEVEPERQREGVRTGEAPLLAETRRLLSRIETVPEARKALRIIGYGEAAAALAQGSTPDALAAAELALAARTRQYAKRQRTWFKKDAPVLDALHAPLTWPPSPPADPRASASPEVPALAALLETLGQWYRT
jgi:tRNA dimethylallyltransferase